jgi:DNA-binding transcriptional MerR regulator
MEEASMLIRDAAAHLGISPSTLRRYIRAGILPEPRRHPVNGWRIWLEQDLTESAKKLSLRPASPNGEPETRTGDVGD